VREEKNPNLLYVEFAFLNGFFNGFLNKFGIPFVVKGLFGPHYGFNLNFHFVMAGFANVPMGHVKVISSRNGSFDDILANITGKSFHIILLAFYD